MTAVSIATAVSDFLSDIATQVKPATLKIYRHYLGRFAAEMGEDALDGLTPSKVRAWGKKYHPIACVRRLTRWAFRDARLIPVDPLADLEKVRRRRRRRTLSRREAVLLMRKATRHFRRMLLALSESIARPHEWRWATWRDIVVSGLRPFTVADLVEGKAFVFYDEFKACQLRADPDAVRIIPISRRLGRMLARLWGDGKDLDAFVLTNRCRRPWSVNAVRCAMRSLRRKLGWGADHRGENVVAYTLRHTGATAAIVAGIGVATLAELMGHADIRMTRRYVHLSPDYLSTALGVIQEAKTRSRPKNDRTI